MRAVYAIRITWVDTPSHLFGPVGSGIIDVGSFILQNQDDMNMVLSALSTVKEGETYYGGGGAAPEFTITRVSDEDLVEHLEGDDVIEETGAPAFS